MRIEFGHDQAARSLLGSLVMLAAASAMIAAGSVQSPKPSAPEPPTPSATGAAPTSTTLAPFREDVKGTALHFEMVPVTPRDPAIKPFLIAKVETTWDLYDVFLFGFDQKEPGGSTPEADAVTRPSKPYISMDRGFGHAGFPVISVSYLGAKRYCEWLSIKTGRTYRLPTVAEWQAACELGLAGIDDRAPLAWSKENASAATKAVGTAKADALGLHDMLGNASEWCTDAEGKGVTLGGTFRDPLATLGCSFVVPYSPDWNASDPQFPKSKWWLADGGFVGFRVVCEVK
jgi:formylglycine-generating enzyme required for sulfatase activity